VAQDDLASELAESSFTTDRRTGNRFQPPLLKPTPARKAGICRSRSVDSHRPRRLTLRVPHSRDLPSDLPDRLVARHPFASLAPASFALRAARGRRPGQFPLARVLTLESPVLARSALCVACGPTHRSLPALGRLNHCSITRSLCHAESQSMKRKG
jgi:hypothetical protein